MPDRAAQPDQAPATGFEITPLMIEAGVRALRENYLALCDSVEYPQIAETVFFRMVEASRRRLG